MTFHLSIFVYRFEIYSTIIMTDLNRLIVQRGQLKSRLTKAPKYYDGLDQENLDLKTITELIVRLGKLTN